MRSKQQKEVEMYCNRLQLDADLALNVSIRHMPELGADASHIRSAIANWTQVSMCMGAQGWMGKWLKVCYALHLCHRRPSVPTSSPCCPLACYPLAFGSCGCVLQNIMVCTLTRAQTSTSAHTCPTCACPPHFQQVSALSLPGSGETAWICDVSMHVVMVSGASPWDSRLFTWLAWKCSSRAR